MQIVWVKTEEKKYETIEKKIKLCMCIVYELKTHSD